MITYSIKASAGSNGNILPAGTATVNHGAEKSFNITPDANYHIKDAVVDGASVGAVTSYQFESVTGYHTIEASFATDTHTINAAAAGNGSIAPSGAVTLNHGTDNILTITAAEGYHVLDVLVDGESVHRGYANDQWRRNVKFTMAK